MITQPLSHQTLSSIGRYNSLCLDGCDQQTAVQLYRQMLRLRRMEEALTKAYHPADEMRCPVHFCIGQESIPAALSLVVQKEDYIFSHHRSHGYFFAKGSPLRDLFAELYGKATGASGGRAGSQDISHAETKFYSGAILGGALSIGVGAAYGLQLQKSPQIVFGGFGEACTEEGAFWEAINLASAKGIPTVLICENNRYSTFSDQIERLAKDNLSEKVAAFGMRAVQIFGNDCILAYKTIQEAAERARREEGPTFIEAFTFRWSSHVGPEDDNVNNYRTEAEIDFWKKNCPIDLLSEQLVKAGWLNADIQSIMEQEIAQEIADCFSFAKSSAFPEPPTDWRPMNIRLDSPKADQLLGQGSNYDFDHTQADARLTSY